MAALALPPGGRPESCQQENKSSGAPPSLTARKDGVVDTGCSPGLPSGGWRPQGQGRVALGTWLGLELGKKQAGAPEQGAVAESWGQCWQGARRCHWAWRWGEMGCRAGSAALCVPLLGGTGLLQERPCDWGKQACPPRPRAQYGDSVGMLRVHPRSQTGGTEAAHHPRSQEAGEEPGVPHRGADLFKAHLTGHRVCSCSLERPRPLHGGTGRGPTWG